ncbi:MAG TPA: winged helix-turn-helix domain-containing protein [Terracidiphilus sp.]|nr:winged helix-turn-helix domain-containing protein [Terracidiphilus sp.]
MTERSQVAYEFANFRLLPQEKQLVCEERKVKLQPKVFDTLLLLVENHGRLVEKDSFLKGLWPDTFVEEATLAHCVSELRRTLRAESNGAEFIETVAKRGYRFLLPVKTTELKAPAAATSASVIAVLPFENLGPEAEREYLADGLTEEVIAALGQIDPVRLSVIGRTTIMRYKRATKSLQEIGSELKAAFLVESSLRSEGGRIRVTSNLVRASDQVQIWSATYDSEPKSMLAFQRELSTTIAQQIRLRLSPERLDALARRQAHNPEAYDAYLQGRYYWNLFTPATTRKAVECYLRATQLDPNYALAWSGLADAYTSSPIHADVRPRDVWEKARRAAEQAIAAEPELAETQTSWGFVKFWLDWDWKETEAAYRRAIAIDPNYSLVYRLLGIVLGHIGHREEEARQAMEHARAIDPLQAMHHALSAQVAFLARDYTAALEFARQSAVVLTDFWIANLQMAQAYEQLGEDALALEALGRGGGVGGENSKVLSMRGYILAKTGRANEAREVLKTLEAMARERYIPPYAIAQVYTGLREDDQAFAWLERGVEEHDVHLAMLPTEPKWDALRGDRRFAEVLRRCGLPYRSS